MLPEGSPLHKYDLPEGTERNFGQGWDKVRDKQRAAVKTLEGTTFPERYRSLLHQYFDDRTSDDK